MRLRIAKKSGFEREIEAVLFDLDGVITETANLHAEAWKRTFDEVLRQQAKGSRDRRFRPFDIKVDYPLYVDGKPRKEGIRSFLASRAIHLPEEKDSEGGALDSVAKTARVKNQHFQRILNEKGVQLFPGATTILETLRRKGMRTALVSSSRNAKPILKVAGIEHMFDVVIDGVIAAERKLKGKPYPDTFLEAAQLLQVTPAKAAIIEDALVGVQAGSRGKFAAVIGVARQTDAAALLNEGADATISSLNELLLVDENGVTPRTT